MLERGGGFGHNSDDVDHFILGRMLIGEHQLARLRAYQPRVRPQQSLLQAAVAIILRDGENGTEFLMMQRAKHERDPWSGQMSFPGGKIDPQDENAKAAAVREAFEEVGAELTEADYIGQLDDLYGLKVDGIFSVHVACFVFKPQLTLALVANHEVADMVWLPLQYLSQRDNAHDYVHPNQTSLNMPSVMINQDKGQVLWGLSLRMLMTLHEVLGWPMSVLSAAQQAQLRDIENRELSPKGIDKITNRRP